MYSKSAKFVVFTRLRDNESLILEACKKDLGKGIFESIVTEIDWCANDCIFVCDNLVKWAKDESAPDMPLSNKLLSPRIRKDPLGCVLIIGSVSLVPIPFLHEMNDTDITSVPTISRFSSPSAL